jgi:mannose-6-phosphate isomerase-like protein (cupin superfamily)
MSASVRRIVTGHDQAGKAIFVEDEATPYVWEAPDGGPVFELWRHAHRPDNSGAYVDPIGPEIELPPPALGSVCRIVEFTPTVDGEPVYLHRTPSLDYSYVISGDIYAVLDDEERLMRTGDVLVQRGTNHGWHNRSGEPCRVLFVLIGAEPLDLPELSSPR